MLVYMIIASHRIREINKAKSIFSLPLEMPSMV